MEISSFHKQFIDDYVAGNFDATEHCLGPHYKEVLNFWIWIEKNQDSVPEFVDDSENQTIAGIARKVTLHQANAWYVTLNVLKASDRCRNNASWAVVELIGMTENIENGYEFPYLKSFEPYELPRN